MNRVVKLGLSALMMVTLCPSMQVLAEGEESQEKTNSEEAIEQVEEVTDGVVALTELSDYATVVNFENMNSDFVVNSNATETIESLIKSSKLIWYKSNGQGGGNNVNALTYGTDYTFDNEYYPVIDNIVRVDAPVTSDTVNSTVGRYYTKISGCGNYTGNLLIGFNIYEQNSIGLLTFSGVNAFIIGVSTDTMEERLSNQTVKLGTWNSTTYDIENPLTYGTDFTIVGYKDINYNDINVDNIYSTPGSYFVVLEGCNSYTGTQTIYFTVYQGSDIGVYYGNAKYDYVVGEESVFQQDLKDNNIYFWDSINSKEVSLTYDMDYEFAGYQDSYGNTIDSSTAFSTTGDIRAILNGKGNYTGTTTVYINVKAADDYSDYYPSLATSSIYSNSTNSITDLLTWTDGRHTKTLTVSEDYTIVGYDKITWDENNNYNIETVENFDFGTAKTGNYRMKLQLNGKDYSRYEEGYQWDRVYFDLIHVPDGATIVTINSLEIDGETFDVVEGEIPSLTGKATVNGGDIDLSSNDSISVNGVWLELSKDYYGNYYADNYTDTVKSFEVGKTYGYYVKLSLKNSDQVVYMNAANVDSVTVKGLSSYDENLYYDQYILDSDNSVNYIYGPYVIKMPSVASSTASSESSSTTVNSWDDGGPFTTDSCGNVFDRWGNKIYEAKGCSVKNGYSLVNTSDKG